jgi:hypothetical protein
MRLPQGGAPIRRRVASPVSFREREEVMRSFIGTWVLALALVANASGGPLAGAEVSASATAAVGYEVVELVRGAPFHLAGGAYVGPDGDLYVASIFGGEIVVLDVDGGEIVGRLGPDDGVLGPDDLVFGPDGSLYWTDMLVGEVGRRTPTAR